MAKAARKKKAVIRRPRRSKENNETDMYIRLELLKMIGAKADDILTLSVAEGMFNYVKTGSGLPHSATVPAPTVSIHVSEGRPTQVEPDIQTPAHAPSEPNHEHKSKFSQLSL
jgi:hypothetical protein